MHKQNSSCDSQAKLIVRSVLKWHKFHRNKKIATTLICYARLMQCSKLVKNRKKNSFFLFIHLPFWMDLNGCQQRLLYAQRLTQRKCSLCLQGNSVNTLNGENVHHVTKLIINVTKVTLKSNCTMYNLYLFSFQTYHKNKLTASISFVSRMFPKVRSR